MHRINPMCLALFRWSRQPSLKYLTATQPPTSRNLLSTSTSGSVTEQYPYHQRGDNKISRQLEIRDRLKMEYILKCPNQMDRLKCLLIKCPEEQKVKIWMTGHMLHVHYPNCSVEHVEGVIEQVLGDLQTTEFIVQPHLRSLLNLSDLHGFRTLMEFDKKVKVYEAGRSPDDDYIYTATGPPDAVTSFTHNLANRLENIRHSEDPVPGYVPVNREFWDVLEGMDGDRNAACYFKDNVVHCWTLNEEAEKNVREQFGSLVHSCSVESRETLKMDYSMLKYVQKLWHSKGVQGLVFPENVDITFDSFDGNTAIMNIKGLQHCVNQTVQKVNAKIREAARISIPIPPEFLTGVSASHFATYWNKYGKELIAALPSVSNPHLTLLGTHDSINHRLLYFYRILRVSYPKEFASLQPKIVFMYESQGLFEFDAKGVIKQLVADFPEVEFEVRKSDRQGPVELIVSGDLDSLIKIDEILKVKVPLSIVAPYYDARKVGKILQKNGLISEEVELRRYQGGTLIKGPPRSASEARDLIRKIVDEGAWYRYFPVQRRTICSSRTLKIIEEFAVCQQMMISVSLFPNSRDSQTQVLKKVEGVGRFDQYVAMRDFLNQLMYPKVSSKLTGVARHKEQWLEDNFANLTEEFDGSLILFKTPKTETGTYWIGGENETVIKAHEVLQTSLDNIILKWIDITENPRFNKDGSGIDQLQSKWPMVTLEIIKSNGKEYLMVVGDSNSTKEISEKLAPPKSSNVTVEVPLTFVGFPFVNYLQSKFVSNVHLTKSKRLKLGSAFPAVRCSMVFKPHWAICLEGEDHDIKDTRNKIEDEMRKIQCRQIVANDRNYEGMRNVLLKSHVWKRIISDHEVTVSLEMDGHEMQTRITVLGDEPAKVEAIHRELKEFVDSFRADEIHLTEAQVLLHRQIIDLVAPEIRNQSHELGFRIDLQEKLVTVFGVTENVQMYADKIRNFISDYTTKTVVPETKLQGLMVADFIRQNYLKSLFPQAFFKYDVEEKVLNVYGPSSTFQNVEDFIKRATKEVYQVKSFKDFRKLERLFRRLSPLGTGVLLFEDRTKREVYLFGSRENVGCIKRAIHFVLHNTEPCNFRIVLSNKVITLSLRSMTSLGLRSVKDKFPGVRWYLKGDEIFFTGPATQAALAVQFIVDKHNEPRKVVCDLESDELSAEVTDRNIEAGRKMCLAKTLNYEYDLYEEID